MCSALSHTCNRAGLMQRSVALPRWAFGRPTPVVQQLQRRQARAEEAVANDPTYVRAVPEQEGCFIVAKSNDTLATMLYDAKVDGSLPRSTNLQPYKEQLDAAAKVYTVDIKGGTCTCSDQQHRNTVCAHMFAVFCSYQATYSFTSLPGSLLNQPHLVIDSRYAAMAGPLEADDDAPPVSVGQARGSELHELYGDIDEQLDIGAPEAAAAAAAAATATAGADEASAPGAGAAAAAEAGAEAPPAAGGEAAAVQGVAGGARSGGRHRALLKLLETATYEVPEQELDKLLPLQVLQQALDAMVPLPPQAQFKCAEGSKGGVHQRQQQQHQQQQQQQRQQVTPGQQRQAAAAGQQTSSNRKRMMPDTVDKENITLAEFTSHRGPGRPKTKDKRPFPLTSNAEVPIAPPHPSTAAATPSGRNPNPDLFAVHPSIPTTHPDYVSLDKQVPASDASLVAAATASGEVARSLPPALYQLVRQGSEGWHGIRSMHVSASQVATMLGFAEPMSAAKLKCPSYADGGGARRVFHQLRTGLPAPSSPSPAMLWGLSHESNARHTFLTVLQQVVAVKWPGKAGQLYETGFAQLSPTPAGLPPIGASCDDLLLLQGEEGGLVVPVEYKTKYPFFPQGPGRPHMYLPSKQQEHVPAFHYAQVQVQMLVTNSRFAILVQSAVECTTVRLVQRNDAWCLNMLLLLQRAHGRYVLAEAIPPQDFGSILMGAQAYEQFLTMTLDACKACEVLTTAPTVKGGDGRVFL